MANCGTRAKLFLISCLLGTGQTLLNDGFAKVFGSVGSVTNVRTTQLLNQLCNESQDEGNTIQRDACYGCFFRSSQQPSGYPMLLSMATCADLYLNNTNYGHCRAYLRNATSTVNSRTSPTIIYCTFLECIRQVNKDSLEALTALSREVNRRPKEAKFVSRKTKSALILKQYIFALRGVCIARRIDTDSNTIRPGAEPVSPRHNDYVARKNITIIRLCVGEAIKMFSNFTLTDVYLAQLFVNTTACILAKTRCSPTNPITGAYRQDADITSKLHIMSVNAVLVNSDYDINIVQLPFGHGVHDECAKYRNLRQANWPSVKCIDTSGFY